MNYHNENDKHQLAQPNFKGCEASFVALSSCVPQVRAMLEAKERVAVGRGERDMELLETDLLELRRRDEEISQLLQTEDSAHFLQVRKEKRDNMWN